MAKHGHLAVVDRLNFGWLSTFFLQNLCMRSTFYVECQEFIKKLITVRRDEAAQKFGRSAKVLVMKSLGALS